VARLKRIGTIALFSAFTVVGVAMAVFGSEEQRIVGAATALFFGGGGLGWAYMTRRRRKPLPGFRLGRVRHRGQDLSGFVVDHDPTTALVSGLTCLALALGCALLLASGAGGEEEAARRWALGIGGVALFGGVGIFALVRAHRGSQLVLSRLGLHTISPAGRIFVPWRAVGGVGETAVHGNRFLTVSVTEPAAMEMGTPQRLIHAAERSMGHDLSFAVRAITVEPGELATAIERYRTEPEARTAIGSERELDVIRSMAPPPAPEEGVAISDGRPMRQVVAIASLFIIGGLGAVIIVGAGLDETEPGRQAARTTGMVAMAVTIGLELLGAVLMVRRNRWGWWVAMTGTILLLGLFSVALAQAESDRRTATLVVVLVLGAHAAFVAWAGRGIRRTEWSRPR
jgi:hypothetical protein